MAQRHSTQGAGAAAPGGSLDESGVAEENARVWSQGDFLAEYLATDLRPPERQLFDRYREDLGGHVLELGCGAGRVTGHLLARAASLEAIDISPVMLEHCRRRHPGASLAQRDLRDLSCYESGAFNAVVAPFCVIDVLGDGDRRALLGEIRRLLAPGGLLIFSSHNLHYAPRIRQPTSVLARSPRRLARNVLRIPLRLRNRRRLRGLERVTADHAILVDEAHDFTLLHYYIDRDAQERQLAALGYELCECLQMGGLPVPGGDRADAHAELHYAARVVG